MAENRQIWAVQMQVFGRKGMNCVCHSREQMAVSVVSDEIQAFRVKYQDYRKLASTFISLDSLGDWC